MREIGNAAGAHRHFNLFLRVDINVGVTAMFGGAIAYKAERNFRILDGLSNVIFSMPRHAILVVVVWVFLRMNIPSSQVPAKQASYRANTD